MSIAISIAILSIVDVFYLRRRIEEARPKRAVEYADGTASSDAVASSRAKRLAGGIASKSSVSTPVVKAEPAKSSGSSALFSFVFGNTAVVETGTSRNTLSKQRESEMVDIIRNPDYLHDISGSVAPDGT